MLRLLRHKRRPLIRWRHGKISLRLSGDNHKKQFLIANWFVLGANQHRLTAPTSVGCRGMGTKIGAGLSRTRTGLIL